MKKLGLGLGIGALSTLAICGGALAILQTSPNTKGKLNVSFEQNDIIGNSAEKNKTELTEKQKQIESLKSQIAEKEMQLEMVISENQNLESVNTNNAETIKVLQDDIEYLNKLLSASLIDEVNIKFPTTWTASENMWVKEISKTKFLLIPYGEEDNGYIYDLLTKEYTDIGFSLNRSTGCIVLADGNLIVAPNGSKCLTLFNPSTLARKDFPVKHYSMTYGASKIKLNDTHTFYYSSDSYGGAFVYDSNKQEIIDISLHDTLGFKFSNNDNSLVNIGDTHFIFNYNMYASSNYADKGSYLLNTKTNTLTSLGVEKVVKFPNKIDDTRYLIDRYILDTSDDSFTMVSDQITCINFSYVLPNGQYLFFNWTNLELYNPTDDTLTEISLETAMSSGGTLKHVVLKNGNIMFGVYNAQNQPTYVFDVQTNTVKKIADCGVIYSCIAINNHQYILSPYTIAYSARGIYLYDMDTNECEAIKTGLAGAYNSVIQLEENIYLIGCMESYGCYLFDLSTKTLLNEETYSMVGVFKLETDEDDNLLVSANFTNGKYRYDYETNTLVLDTYVYKR